MILPSIRSIPRGRRAAVAILSLVALTLPGAGATRAQHATPGPIPVTPLTGVTSLEASAHLSVDGTVDGEPAQGDLTVTLASNDVPSSRIDISGTLLEPIVANFGGSAITLFTPSSVSVYAMPDGAYILLDLFVDVCIKPDGAAATAAVDQLSPEALMAIVTGPEVAHGTYVGQETIDGTTVDHYLIDGETFLAAAQASADPEVSAFAANLIEVSDADLYLSTEGGYPVAYRGAFTGAYVPLGLEGAVQVEIVLTGIDTPVEVELPGRCDHPIGV